MGNNKLKISVVTVSYNAAATIEETIQSVVNQTYDNIEYIIIDGGSTDGTVDIIKKYADRIAYLVSEPDGGIYDAMNKGIAVATGDYINFMNAGDRFNGKHILEEVFDSSINISLADIIYGNAIFSYPWGNLLVRPRALTEFKSYDPIFHQSSFTKLLLLKNLPFDISFKIAGDYNFFYKCYISDKKFKYLDISMAIFDASDGISSNAIGLRLEEGLRITGQKSCLRFKIKKLLMIVKYTIRMLVNKVSPSFAGYLQKKLLLKRNRISDTNE